MADERVHHAIKIVDPTTTTQQAGVNASGQLAIAGPVTNAGTFVVQEDGAALTALQLIDDIVYTDDTDTHATGTSKGAGIMAAATPTDTAVAANDIGMLAMSLDRRLHTDTDITASVALDVSAATVNVDLVAGTALTALELIDDTVATLGTTTYLEATTKGTIMGAVRNDTLAALADTDNEIAPLQVDASGSLYVTGGGGGTEYTQDAVSADPATAATWLMPRDDVLTTQETADNDWTLPRANARGAQWVELDATNPVTVASHAVTNAGTFAVQEDGAALTALQLIDNPIQVFGTDTYLEATDSAMMIGVVRNDTLAALANTDNEIAPLQVNALGALYVDISAQPLATGSNTIGEVTIGAASTAAGDLAKAEDVAHGTGDVGVMALAVRRDTPTSIADADNDYLPLTTDSAGRLHVTDPNAGAGVPAGEAITVTTVAAIAAGSTSTTNLQTAELGGSTKKLAGVDVSASVPIRVSIDEVNDDAVTTKVVLFGGAAEPIQWRPAHKDYFEKAFAANAGFDGWRATVTNMDTSEAADLYATFYTEN
jgi:hypothetical protein